MYGSLEGDATARPRRRAHASWPHASAAASTCSAISSNDTDSMRCSAWPAMVARHLALSRSAHRGVPTYTMTQCGYWSLAASLGKSPRTPALLGDKPDVVTIAGRPAGSGPVGRPGRTASRSPPTDLANGGNGRRHDSFVEHEAVPLDCLGAADGHGWRALWSAATADIYAVLEEHGSTGLCAALTRIAHCDRGDERGRPRGGAIHSSGVLFRDLLGTINRRVAAVTTVHLVIAGRVLKL